EWSDVRQLGRKAEAWYRENLVGTTVTMKRTGWRIQFGRVGSKKLGGRKGDILLRMVPGLARIIENAELLSTVPGAKPGTERQTFHTAVAVVELAGEQHRVIVTLREDANGTFHYDLSTDRGAEADRSEAAGRVTEARSGLADSLGDLNLAFDEPEINSNPTLTPADARRVNSAANDELARVGIGRSVRAEVGGDRSGAQGSYGRGVIRILRPGGNWKHTLDHEIIHALRDADLWDRDYGLFSADEWRALSRAARADESIRSRVEASYPDLDTTGQTEEMVAELYADWARGHRETPAGPLEHAFERIRSFFRAVASALRGEGFQDAARIMSRIASGEVGRRGPDGPGGGGNRQTKEQRGSDSQSDTFAAEFMAELASNDDMFAYPRARSGSIAGVFAEIDPTIKFVGDTARADEAEETGADRRYLLRTAKGTDFYVFETDDSVWIDVSQLGEGDGGSAIYAAVADYAANAGLKFIGDPAGLSDIALRRRTEAMLSSAFKHGSTDHLAPHQRQIDGDASLGIPPLRWTEGDTLGNMQALIEVSTASLAHHVPEIARARYDFATRTFRTGKGEQITDRALGEWSATKGRIRAAGAGSRTLKRSILFNTLLRAESGQRPGLLERSLQQSRQLVTEGGLTRILYQRDMAAIKDQLSRSKGRALGMIGSFNWRKTPEFFSNLLTDAMGKNDSWNILSLVPGNALFEELAKGLPAAAKYLSEKRQMDAWRNDWQARAAKVVDGWTSIARKNPAANDALMDLMHGTTLSGVDPTRPDSWRRHADGEAARVLRDPLASPARKDWARGIQKQADDRKAKWDDAKVKLDALPAEFQEMYEKARNEYAAMADEQEGALMQNIRAA
ncbi:MAG: hypothetical protein Q4G26_15880, partial [Paracoccus sp. (in: a-proteobacteria)]|nr:hypothetical protein [Paracoccus sp. (in: a-proteobacteria)]